MLCDGKLVQNASPSPAGSAHLLQPPLRVGRRQLAAAHAWQPPPSARQQPTLRLQYRRVSGLAASSASSIHLQRCLVTHYVMLMFRMAPFRMSSIYLQGKPAHGATPAHAMPCQPMPCHAAMLQGFQAEFIATHGVKRKSGNSLARRPACGAECRPGGMHVVGAVLAAQASAAQCLSRSPPLHVAKLLESTMLPPPPSDKQPTPVAGLLYQPLSPRYLGHKAAVDVLKSTCKSVWHRLTKEALLLCPPVIVPRHPDVAPTGVHPVKHHHAGRLPPAPGDVTLEVSNSHPTRRPRSSRSSCAYVGRRGAQQHRQRWQRVRAANEDRGAGAIHAGRSQSVCSSSRSRMRRSGSAPMRCGSRQPGPQGCCRAPAGRRTAARSHASMHALAQ